MLTASLVGLLGRLIISSNETRDVVLPLTGVSVEAEVVDFIGEVKLSQCFRNSEKVPIEAVYYFPVDDASSVCDFHAEYEDGSVVNGVVKEKGKAKEEYNYAKESGKQANLLEVTRRDIFTLNIGNLPPGGYVKIVITYVTSLKAQNDAIAFILPTCIAPRYSPPNNPPTASEAQAVAPPSSCVRLFGLTMNVKFRCRTNIKSIACPTHAAETGINFQTHGRTGTVLLKDVAMDRNLLLLVTEEKPHQPRAGIEVGENGSLAGFVTIFPQLEFKDIEREIIFVIDRSGSMGCNNRSVGKTQIEQARDALTLFLRALPTSCTFNVVGFGSRFETLFDESKRYNDENLDTATRYAMQMGANMGGTEIRAPLAHIFKQKVSSRISRQVFILTDGQVSNDLEVFDVIRKHCSTNKCRVFSLGIGSATSRHLIEGMARAGRGTSRFVEGGDSSCLRAKVMSQLKQALQPALDEVSVEWAFPVKRKEKSKIPTEPLHHVVKTLLGYRSPSIDECPKRPELRKFPSVNPPIFNQERFLSFVLLPPEETTIPESVTIKCNSPDGPLEVRVDISDNEVFHGSIAHKMAARAAITEHEDGTNQGLHLYATRGAISEAEALQLALDNNLASNKTSFIAVKEEACVEPGTEAAVQVIPQFAPVDPPFLLPTTSEQRFARSGYPHNPGVRSSTPIIGSVARSHSTASSATMRSLAIGLTSPSFSRARPARYTRDDGPPIMRSIKMPEEGRSSCGLVGAASNQKQRLEGRHSSGRCAGTSGFLSGNRRPSAQSVGDDNVVHRVNVPDSVRPGEEFQVYAGNRIVRVRCPKDCRPGGPLQVCHHDKDRRRPTDLALNKRNKQQQHLKMKGKYSYYDRPIKLEKEETWATRKGCMTSPSIEDTRPAAIVLDSDTNNDITANKKKGKDSSLALSSDQQLLRLCLLQKANGSFLLDDSLARAVGISTQKMNHMADSRPTAVKLFATFLAIAVMRARFAQHREEWELQEVKATGWLISQGLCESEINSVVESLELQLKNV